MYSQRLVLLMARQPNSRTCHYQLGYLWNSPAIPCYNYNGTLDNVDGAIFLLLKAHARILGMSIFLLGWTRQFEKMCTSLTFICHLHERELLR